MNGATEATLAELLRVAQEQNANLASLNQLLAGRSSGGGSGGGGLGDMAKNIPLVNVAFSILGAAASVVGSAFEMIGNVVGKMVDGIGSAIKGLWGFSQKAMEGTARMSDLFDAFGKLPFFLGELFQVGAGLLRILEKLTDEYIMMSKVGAGFTGGLTEMRNVAQGLAIGFGDLAAMTSKNSQALAEAGGTVSGGFKRFVSGMDVLMGPGSQFRDSMFALGVSSKEAGEYMMTMMKLQQVQIRNGKVDAESLGRQTKDYIENLDQLTRLTGLHRDQVNELMKKQADDQVFENWKDSLGADKAAEISNLIAISTARMGANYTENVLKPQLMGIATPINEASIKIAQATNGASVQMFSRIREIQNSNLSSAEKGKAAFMVFGDIATKGKQTADMLGALGKLEGMPIDKEMLKFGRIFAAGGEKAYAQAQLEAETAKKRNGNNVSLMEMQENMIRFGNTLTITLAGIAERWGPTLISIGTWIMNNLIVGLDKFLKWLDSPAVKDAWNTLVSFFNGVILPKLQKIGAWFGETWDQLVKAWTKDGISGVMVVMKDRIGDGVKNIWDDLKKLWNVVSPEIIKIWNNDIKPVLLSMWDVLLKKMFDSIGNAIHEWMYGPEIKDSNERANLEKDDARAQKEMSWSEWGKTLYLRANEQLVGALASVGILTADAQDRMFKQRVMDQNTERNQRLGATVHGRASGGIVNPGTYLVGERGPELLTVGDKGNVITNENLQQLLSRMASNSDNKDLTTLLEALNNTMNQLVYHSRDTAEYTRRTAGEIAGLNSNILPQI